MSYNNKTIQNMVEKDFIRDFIEGLTSADSRISCLQTSTQIEAMFNDDNTLPAFDIVVGDVMNIHFLRRDNQSFYNMTITSSNRLGNDNKIVVPEWQVCTTYNTSKKDIVVRECAFSVVTNKNAVLISMCNAGGNLFDPKVTLIMIKSGDINVCAAREGNGDIMEQPFYFNDGIVTKSRNRLAYIYNSGDYSNIKIILDKEFLVQDIDHHKATLSGVCDSSYINSIRVPTRINGKQYYVVNNYTIMPIEG